MQRLHEYSYKQFSIASSGLLCNYLGPLLCSYIQWKCFRTVLYILRLIVLGGGTSTTVSFHDINLELTVTANKEEKCSIDIAL